MVAFEGRSPAWRALAAGRRVKYGPASSSGDGGPTGKTVSEGAAIPPPQWAVGPARRRPHEPYGERLGLVPGGVQERAHRDHGGVALGRAHALPGDAEVRQGGDRPGDRRRRGEPERLHGPRLHGLLLDRPPGAPRPPPRHRGGPDDPRAPRPQGGRAGTDRDPLGAGGRGELAGVPGRRGGRRARLPAPPVPVGPARLPGGHPRAHPEGPAGVLPPLLRDPQRGPRRLGWVRSRLDRPSGPGDVRPPPVHRRGPQGPGERTRGGPGASLAA